MKGTVHGVGVRAKDLAAVDEKANAAKEAALGGSDQQYSDAKPYHKGDYCNKDGKLYKCVTAIKTPEPWTPAHWVETTITDELKEAMEGGGGGGGGNVIKITFGVEFVGSEYIVTDNAGEEKRGTVPENRVANVSVTGCNTTYVIKATADGVEYSNSLTTGPYYGQYSTVLNVFAATIKVTTAAGATVTATADGLTFSAVANASGVALVAVKKAATYSIGATKGTKTSGSASASVTTEGSTVTAAVSFTVENVPSQAEPLTYSGKKQSPTWNDCDDEEITMGGTLEATDAGTRNATASLNTGYVWKGGGTAAKNVPWTIDQADGTLTIDKTTMSVNGSSPTGQIGVTRSGNGTIHASSDNTDVATVAIDGDNVVVTGHSDGTAHISITVDASTNYKAVTTPKQCTVTASNMVKIYGVSWNYVSTATTTALTRLKSDNDPNNLVNTNISTAPSPAVGTGAGSSPFDSLMPWSGMVEYNFNGDTRGAKKGESGFSRTNADTMVYIPEFYYKVMDNPSSTTRCFYVADKPATGFTKHPGSGKYVGRYNTISGYYSKSGATPLTGIKRSEARTGSKGKGNKWSQYDFASWCAVWLLYLVEYADWDSQTKIGKGIVNDSKQGTGKTDSMTYHTGRAAGDDGKTAVQYRWIENPWGNVYDWIDGVNFDGRKAYVCLDRTKFADDTASNYTDTGVTLASSGWIKGLGVSSAAPWAFLPNEVGGSETTRIPDYLNSDTGWRVLYVGGFYSYGTFAGLFYFNAGSVSSSPSGNVGARLLVSP